MPDRSALTEVSESTTLTWSTGRTSRFSAYRQVVRNLSVRACILIYRRSSCLAIFFLLSPTLNPSTANKTRPLTHLLPPAPTEVCAIGRRLGFQHNTNWADCPERITAMFGQMMVEPVVQLDPARRSADSDSHTDKGCRKRRDRSLDRVAGVGPAVLARARRSGFWGGLCPRPQERNLVRRGLRGRTIRRVQRKPARTMVVVISNARYDRGHTQHGCLPVPVTKVLVEW